MCWKIPAAFKKQSTAPSSSISCVRSFFAPICVYSAAILNKVDAFSSVIVFWHVGSPKCAKYFRFQFNFDFICLPAGAEICVTCLVTRPRRKEFAWHCGAAYLLMSRTTQSTSRCFGRRERIFARRSTACCSIYTAARHRSRLSSAFALPNEDYYN